MAIVDFRLLILFGEKENSVALCGQSPSFNTDCRFSVVTSFEEKKTLWLSVNNPPV
jgi:hypothetical protein